MARPLQHLAVMSEVSGLWKRGSMRYPDGRIDSDTQVYWLQTEHLYADLRVPASLEPGAFEGGFDALGDDALVGLAALNGFAGTLDYDGSICRWHRELDYRPPGGPPDEAHATIDGDTLVETGLHADYAEDWHRQTGRDAPLVAFRSAGGILVIAGEHFIEILDRPVALPAGADLADLVAGDLAAGDRTAAIERLGMRISYGMLRAGGGVIRLSTFPWLCGRALYAAATWRGRETLVLDGGREWSLVSSTVDTDTIAAWFG